MHCSGHCALLRTKCTAQDTVYCCYTCCHDTRLSLMINQGQPRPCAGKGGPNPLSYVPLCLCAYNIFRIGQNHTYTEYIRYFWQGNHQKYGVYIRFWPTLNIFTRKRARTRLTKNVFIYGASMHSILSRDLVCRCVRCVCMHLILANFI